MTAYEDHLDEPCVSPPMRVGRTMVCRRKDEPEYVWVVRDDHLTLGVYRRLRDAAAAHLTDRHVPQGHDPDGTCYSYADGDYRWVSFVRHELRGSPIHVG